MVEATELIDSVEQDIEEIRENFMPGFEWFNERPGEMMEREVATECIVEDLDVDGDIADHVISHLVSDDMDPVQQVTQPGGDRMVGIISYEEHDGWFYSFDRYDDVHGQTKRAVCGHCIHEEEYETDVKHYSASVEMFDEDDASSLLGIHYAVDHDDRSLSDALDETFNIDVETLSMLLGVDPDELDLRTTTRGIRELKKNGAVLGDQDYIDVPALDLAPGATLVSGTTMGGSQAWHDGNVSAGNNISISTQTISVDPQIYVQSTEPSSPATNDLWVDTS